jgi:hypothetical protein
VSARSAAARLTAALAVATLATLARTSRAADVLRGGAVFPSNLDGDSAYHLRRTLAASLDFPSVLVVDPLTNWPEGGPCPWAPGFDQLGAALVILSGAAGTARAPAIAAALPVLLGVGAALAAGAAARRAIPAEAPRLAAGLAAGLAAALAPAAVALGLLGRTDHHVAELLSYGLLGAWALADAGEGPAARRYEAAGALIVGGSLWLFSGALIYLAIAGGMLILRQLAGRGGGGLVGSGAAGFFGGGLLAAASYGPLIPEHGVWFSYRFPSLLQPALAGLAGLGVGATAALVGLWRRAGGLSSPAVRRALGGGGLAALAAGAALAGPVSAGLSEWLFRSDPWLAGIAEFQPLLGSPLGEAAAWAEAWGAFGWLLPAGLALSGVATAALARQRPGRALALAAWVLGALALALLQRRFSGIAATALAAGTGAGLAALLARAPRLAPAGPALVLALSLASPGWREALVRQPAGPLDSVAQAALYVRGAAPPGGPGPGVLAPWDMGHLVLLLSGKPVPANGFGTFLDEEAFAAVMGAYTGGEADVLALTGERDLGWVVAGARTFVTARILEGRPEPFLMDPQERWVLNPEFVRGLPFAAAIQGGSGLPAAGVPHLERLCPVYASADRIPRTALGLPWIWVYQPVAGALLVGQAPPGARVVGEIALETPGGPVPFRAWTDAGPDGAWQLRVPVPGGRGGALPTGAWRLRVGEAPPIEVAVSEAAVRTGATLALPRERAADDP